MMHEWNKEEEEVCMPPTDEEEQQVLKHWTCPNQGIVQKMAQNVAVLVSGQGRLEKWAKETNGTMADIQKDQYRMQGAIGAWRWVFAAGVAVTGLAISATGVAVAIWLT